MNPDPRLHHTAKRIQRGSLGNVIEMFALLGCKVSYRPEGNGWAMIGQEGLNFDIQLIEVDGIPLEGETRRDSQISFVSENPTDHINKVHIWAEEKNLTFIQKSWNEREHYFDLPDLFVDWVVEVMHISVVES
ncbi:MAG: hypothetical protein JWO50_582 [Candidatus Kaiserbacteria bacterium]|nr:hypothetical protein [Candidatus Kaiserbacteria bacterium]